jgi:tetratricopeptide (TPR) repeat protein
VALNETANQMAQHGRLDEAGAKYREALDIDPHFAIAWNNLGVVEMARRNTTRAVWAYQHAIDDNPTYALAYYNLGVTYDAKRQFDQALRNYQKAFELDPTLGDVKKNPAVVSNRYLAAAMAQSYLDRGGVSRLPVQSALPPPAPPLAKPAKTPKAP